MRRKQVNVVINREKCTEQIIENCKLCMNECPKALFFTIPSITPRKGILSGGWRLETAMMSMCDECGKCVSVCPQGAISIKKD